MHTLLTILNWVICIVLCFCFAWKMRKGVGLDKNTWETTDPAYIKKGELTNFWIGLGILSIVFGSLGAIAQKYINNL